VTVKTDQDTQHQNASASSENYNPDNIVTPLVKLELTETSQPVVKSQHESQKQSEISTKTSSLAMEEKDVETPEAEHQQYPAEHHQNHVEHQHHHHAEHSMMASTMMANTMAVNSVVGGQMTQNMPLAVPMMANTMHSSVTRNDAKIITESRLKRLRALSQKPDETLTNGQKDEKKRIVRLEKNRRAAAMSRRKKKVYVKNLEENSKLMARHIAILEMENSHLRAFLNVSQQQQLPMRPGMPGMASMRPGMPMGQQFAGAMAGGPMGQHQYMSQSTTGSNSAAQSGTSHSASTRSSLEPPSKKRKLEHGSADSTISPSESPMNISEMDSGASLDIKTDPAQLDPLPLPVPPTSAPPAMPRMMPGMMQGQMGGMMPGMMMPGMRGMMPPNRMMGQMPGQMPGQMMGQMHGMQPQMMGQMQGQMPGQMPNQMQGQMAGYGMGGMPNNQAHQQTLAPEIGKLEAIVTQSKDQKLEVEECESKSVDSEMYRGYLDMPPEVSGDDDDNFNLMMDQSNLVIEETVDECGKVFEVDSKSNMMVF